jgi:hypothetical protein
MKPEHFAHVVFTDNNTSIKWDTTVKIPQVESDDDSDDSKAPETEDDILPQNSCDRYFDLVTNAVENIWGTMAVWQKTGRFNSGRVITKGRHGEKDSHTDLLTVKMELIK